jgi:UDP-glucuronate 4-epimerase
MKTYLVTGAAGFVGSQVCIALLDSGSQVIGMDNFDPFYGQALKQANIKAIAGRVGFRFVEADITNLASLHAQLRARLDGIVHLAAKAGVRPSIEQPLEYQHVNVTGTQAVLEFARCREIEQFVFASSSSVYGINPRVPWREDDHVLQPISPYASTKVSGELLGHVYSHLYGIRFLALRLFTVYGPRQRPDLAIRKYSELMLNGKDIPVFGDGSSSRDYTYVDDVVAAILSALDYDRSKFEVINVGNDRPVALLEMIRTLESALGLTAKLEFLPQQPGDVPRTCADIRKARTVLGYEPRIPFELGINRFASWIRTDRARSRVERSPATPGIMGGNQEQATSYAAIPLRK